MTEEVGGGREAGGPSARWAPALVATGAVSVQFGAAIATHLFRRVGPEGAVTLRLVLAAAALALVNWRAAPKLRRLAERRPDMYVAIGFGLVLGAMNLFFYEAIARIPLGVAVTVEFVGPLAVTVGFSRRRSDVLWAVLAAGGVVLLAGGDALGAVRHLDLAGVGFALGAGACWAGYILLNAETGRRFGGTSGLAIAMVVGSLLVLPFGLSAAGAVLFEPYVLGLGLSVAVLSSVVPYSLELFALRRVSARAFGILLSMDPAIAALVGLAVLGQRLSSSEVVALLLVVVANVGSHVFDTRGPAVADAGGGLVG